MSINKKTKLKEAFGEQGLTTPKPFNRYEPSDIERTIQGVLKKNFKDVTLEVYRHQGETEYINLNLSTNLEDIEEDLELRRYIIAKFLSTFRQEFFTELSKYINVVNVKNGPYEFVKGSDKIKFNMTILLSDNNISDWVSGTRRKTISNKEFMKESKHLKEISDDTLKSSIHKSVNQGRNGKYKKFNDYFFKDLVGKELDLGVITKINIIDSNSNFVIELNPSKQNSTSPISKIYYNDHKYELPHNFKIKRNDAVLLTKIAKKVDPSSQVNLHKDFNIAGDHFVESKQSKAFNTGDKDEFEVKNKLIKHGFKASVIKDKEVKVTWNDKKYSEDDIKKIIENKNTMSDNKITLNEVKNILEKLYESVLTEERRQMTSNKRSTPTKKKPQKQVKQRK